MSGFSSDSDSDTSMPPGVTDEERLSRVEQRLAVYEQREREMTSALSARRHDNDDVNLTARLEQIEQEREEREKLEQEKLEQEKLEREREQKDMQEKQKLERDKNELREIERLELDSMEETKYRNDHYRNLSHRDVRNDIDGSFILDGRKGDPAGRVKVSIQPEQWQQPGQHTEAPEGGKPADILVNKGNNLYFLCP